MTFTDRYYSPKTVDSLREHTHQSGFVVMIFEYNEKHDGFMCYGLTQEDYYERYNAGTLQ